jgi:hypothetical protein
MTRPTAWQRGGTRRLAQPNVHRVNVDPDDVIRTYTDDRSGNPLEIAGNGSTGPAGVQCLQHDHHRRITEAWTQNNTGCAATPSGTIGGAAPYWQSHSYDQAETAPLMSITVSVGPRMSRPVCIYSCG